MTPGIPPLFKGWLKGGTHVLLDVVWAAHTAVCDEHDESEDEPLMVLPLEPWEAGRVAMEMVMVSRNSRRDPGAYLPGMKRVVDEIEHPQHMTDVALSLASMVTVLAKDEDMARFGTYILHHESEAMK